MFDNKIVDNSLDFLFDNSFDFSFNNLFSGGAGGVRKSNKSSTANFIIDRDFSSNSVLALYNIENKFEEINNTSNYILDNSFSLKSNFAFYKLGIIQYPPKRIVIKGFDD